MKKIFTILSAALIALSANAEFNYGAALTETDFNSSSTVVTKEGTIEWDNGAVRCGGSSTSIAGGPAWYWEDKYFDVKLMNGVPNKLTFQYKGNSSGSTDVKYYVQQSADGQNWTDLWSVTKNKTSYTSVSEDLDKTTRYLRFCFHGNFAGLFKDIKVTEKILMGTPSSESFDFGTVKVDDAVTAQTFELGWTNLEATATSSDAHFTITPANFGEIGLAYQKTEFSVSLLTNEAGEYSGTITLAGRGKSATVSVSGKVEKYDQQITWAPAAQYNYGETIAPATANSGLDVAYEVSDEKVIKVVDGALKMVHGGTVTVTAKQAGNYKYNAAENVVKTITVVPPTTYGSFTQTTCGEAVTFNGVEYTETTKKDVNVGENHLGGDSIVKVDIVINHPSAKQESKTIVYGTVETWNGFDLSVEKVGTRDLVYTTTNVVGCDSVVTLTLTVNKMETLEATQTLEFCEDDSVEYRDVWYKTAGNYPVSVTGEIRDTLITVAVTQNAKDYIAKSETINAGESITWKDAEVVLEEAGDTTFVDSLYNVNGCDSVIVLTVHVNPAIPSAIGNTKTTVETEKVFRNGQMFILRGKEMFDVTGRKQD